MNNETKRKTLKLNQNIKININSIINSEFNSFNRKKQTSTSSSAKEDTKLDDMKSFLNNTQDGFKQNIKNKEIKNLDLKKKKEDKKEESQLEENTNNENNNKIEDNKETVEKQEHIDVHKILNKVLLEEKKENEKIENKKEEIKKEEKFQKKQEDFKKQNENSNKNNFIETNDNKQKNSFKNFKNKNKKNNFNKYDDNDFEENNNNKKGRKITYVLSSDDEGYNFRRNKNFFKKKEKSTEPQKKIIQDIELPEFITVSDLAEKMNEKKVDVVKKLISIGMPCTINQTIDADTAEILINEFGHRVKKRVTEHDFEDKLNERIGTQFVPKDPVVTIMGHVDHGKTSLLDAIRSTKVTESEFGGITQHIGATRIQTKNGKSITFIDTPGHEAFTEMRIRGAQITDIVVLVVAADDGVKEQTIEAINHSKAANVPIILAINKIDKPNANPRRVKEELLQYDIITEDFGGNVLSVEVSAKEKTNLDKLLDTILLQAEMMELKAPIDVKPYGVVIESKMDQKKGSIVTLLVQGGILKNSDLILSGKSYGRIKKMIDDKNKVCNEVHPAMAVEILGLDSVPNSGEKFYVVDTEKEAKEIISYREKKDLENKSSKKQNIDSLLKTVSGKKAKLLSIILKTDVNGSIEAIKGSLNKLNTEDFEVDVIHSATGMINESDINLAIISNAIVIGFNVKANQSAMELAKSKNIDIRYYTIIYNIIDDVNNILHGMLEPVLKENILGHAEVRQIFKITNVGKIAGVIVTDGIISKNSKLRVIRDGVIIYTGDLKNLKHFKEDVKELKNGFEGGISIQNYDDLKEKDIIESFNTVTVN